MFKDPEVRKAQCGMGLEAGWNLVCVSVHLHL